MTTPLRIGHLLRAHHRLFAAFLVTLSLATWTAAGASAWFVRGIITGLPGEADLREIGTMAQSTALLDVHGRPAFTIFKEQRIEVPLERISPNLVDAILAIEDQRFYDHGGLDIVRIAGAAWTNLREGRAVQGGSTLTQQLARQSFLTSEKTLRRKLKEVVLATRIESEFDKKRILELYLNKVYFGDGLYGVEAASLGYFGKHASEVDIAEAALLAGLVKSPSTYAPTVNLERASARRDVVLQAMRSAGVIDAAVFEQAMAQPVELRDALRKEEAYGQYFKEEVRKQLVERFGWERVYQGGLIVHTTLDLELQKVAEAEVVRGLEEIEQRQRRRESEADGPLQGALVAMDPHTGEVRAMVGGRDFGASRFNRATQAQRQPGSAFKPFVYAAALERGFSPATLLTGLNDPLETPEGEWVPEDEHSSGSSMTMRTALRTSSNRAAVRMLREVGIPPAVRYAERLGVGSVPGVWSMALGSGEVTLLSMTAAFATFANEGMRPSPSLVRRVETVDGEVLLDSGAAPQRAVSEATAYLMTHMLTDVVNGGTAAGVRRVGFTGQAAGKTGTTNDYRDAWFIGYTPALVTGVWVGYDMPRTIIREGYAGRLAVPIWGRFMKAAARDQKKGDWFTPPRTVTTATICRLSGRLATSDCRNATTIDDDGSVTIASTAYTEYFVRGTEPSRYCDLHDRYEDQAWRAVATTGSSDERAPEDRAAAAVTRPAAQATRPAAQPAGPGGAAAAPVTAAEASPAARATQAEPAAAPAEERRGFWSRLFRRGPREPQERDDDRQEEAAPPAPAPERE
jgi:penicillin-binding protein 1A